MVLLHLLTFGRVLFFKNIDIPPELLHAYMSPWILEFWTRIKKVKPRRECRCEWGDSLWRFDIDCWPRLNFIEHLNEGLFRVEFSLIILWIYVDLVTKFFGLGDTHDFSTVCKQFFLIEIDNFVLAFNFRSKNIFFHLCLFFNWSNSYCVLAIWRILMFFFLG